jgi:hypothetical protein
MEPEGYPEWPGNGPEVKVTVAKGQRKQREQKQQQLQLQQQEEAGRAVNGGLRGFSRARHEKLTTQKHPSRIIILKIIFGPRGRIIRVTKTFVPLRYVDLILGKSTLYFD